MPHVSVSGRAGSARLVLDQADLKGEKKSPHQIQMKTNQDHIDLSELKEYEVENPSVQLRRLATQVVGRHGSKWLLLLTREIAMLHGLDGE